MTRCPICKNDVDPAQLGQPGSVYPFCSERCKLIDLGRWLSGKYQIPVEAEDDEDAGLSDEGADERGR